MQAIRAQGIDAESYLHRLSEVVQLAGVRIAKMGLMWALLGVGERLDVLERRNLSREEQVRDLRLVVRLVPGPLLGLGMEHPEHLHTGRGAEPSPLIVEPARLVKPLPPPIGARVEDLHAPGQQKATDVPKRLAALEVQIVQSGLGARLAGGDGRHGGFTAVLGMAA
jgi:hypothetical protein